MHNHDRTIGVSYGANGYSNAHALTAGSHSEGYVSSSIDTALESTPNAADLATVRAEPWLMAANEPQQRLQDLTVPSSIGDAKAGQHDAVSKVKYAAL